MADRQPQGTRLGYGFAIAQAVLYSMMGIFGKLLYDTGLSAQETVILRYLATTVILGAVLLAWRKHRLVSRDPIVYVQAAFFFVSTLFYFLAVERLSAGIATVIFYLYPVLVAILSLAVLHERLSVPTAVALGFAVGGLLLVSGVAESEVVLDGAGLVYGAISCVAFAVYTVLVQKAGRAEDPFTLTFTISWTNLVAAAVIFAPSVPTMLRLDAAQLGLGSLLALLCTIAPMLLYIVAIKRIGGTKTALIGISQTPFSLLFAYLILGEQLTVLQGVGAALIVAGIAIVTVASGKDGPGPAGSKPETLAGSGALEGLSSPAGLGRRPGSGEPQG